MSLNEREYCIAVFSKAFNTDHAQYFIQVIIYYFPLITILAWEWFDEHAFFYMRKSTPCKFLNFHDSDNTCWSVYEQETPLTIRRYMCKWADNHQYRCSNPSKKTCYRIDVS